MESWETGVLEKYIFNERKNWIIYNNITYSFKFISFVFGEWKTMHSIFTLVIFEIILLGSHMPFLASSIKIKYITGLNNSVMILTYLLPCFLNT